ncbi:MAG: hypothetical protein HC862_00975 [Scytonema sp. RU_4_4]|nr:hypothetical protein [Scytonema sp. RU_4_4]
MARKETPTLNGRASSLCWENARCSTWGDTPDGTLGGTSKGALAPQDDPLLQSLFPTPDALLGVSPRPHWLLRRHVASALAPGLLRLVSPVT